MGKRCISFAACAALVLALGALSRAQSMPHPQWVGTWSTSPMLAEDAFDVHPFSGVTLREVVHVSVGGSQLRVRFTNAYGTDPLTISDAHVALSAGNAAIQPGIDRAITFGGATTVNIPPGAELFSDPVALAVPALSDLAVSFYLPSQVVRAKPSTPSPIRTTFSPTAMSPRRRICPAPQKSPRGTSLTVSMSPPSPAPALSSRSATPLLTARIPLPTAIAAGPTISPRVSTWILVSKTFPS